MIRRSFALSVLLCSMFLLVACGEDQQEVKPQVKAVKTVVVAKATGENRRTLSGVVKTADESNLSFRVKGRVASVNVKRGQAVSEGQVLAKLEQKDYVLAVNSAKAKLQSTRANLVTKEEDVKRQRELLKQDFVSKAATEKAENAYQEALSNVAVAESDLQTAEDNLARTILKAPFSGKIADKKVEAFTEVSAGETVFTIQSAQGLEVEILIPETMVRNVNHGDVANVSFPTLQNVNVGAVVSEIGARSESGNAFPATAKLADNAADIRPGMTAEVSLSVGSRGDSPSFLIPTSAIDLRFFAEENNKEVTSVFVVNNDVLKTVNVSIDDVRGNQLEVSGGIKEGDRIVVAGVSFLSEGQKVKLWEPRYSIPATLNK